MIYESKYLMLHDKVIREKRKERYYTHIHNKIRNTHDNYSPCSATGHMVVPGIYNYFLPLPIPYSLCPRQVMVLYHVWVG